MSLPRSNDTVLKEQSVRDEYLVALVSSPLAAENFSMSRHKTLNQYDRYDRAGANQSTLECHTKRIGFVNIHVMAENDVIPAGMGVPNLK